MKKQRILSESVVNYLEQRFREIFITKVEFTNFKDEIFNKLDNILQEIVTNREEMAVMSERSSDHEDILEILEKIHLQGMRFS